MVTKKPSLKKTRKPTKETRPKSRVQRSDSAPSSAAASMESIATQMRSVAGKMLDLGAGAVKTTRTLHMASQVARSLSGGGSTLDKARGIARAVGASGMLSVPATPPKVSATASRAGKALRVMREAAGITVDEVSKALNLKDAALIDSVETGRAAMPFELILRLAAVIGRNDPLGFVVNLTRTANPDLWRSLDQLGVGKLLLQSAREREFANILRADDSARQLSDQEFAEVLAFTKAAFEMAMAFRQRARARG
jgi:transcriptional regulator with XRE-family HTH domain